MVWCGWFDVDKKAEWGSVLKGQFLPGSTNQTEAGRWGRFMGNLLRGCIMIISVHAASAEEKKKEFPTEEMICGKKPVTNENHGFISEKYVSGSSSIRLLVQMFQLEKDRQNGRKCLFLSLSEEVSTVRQTEHSMNYSRPGVALFF